MPNPYLHLWLLDSNYQLKAVSPLKIPLSTGQLWEAYNMLPLLGLSYHMWSTKCVNTCINPKNIISKQPKGFSDTWQALCNMDSSCNHPPLFIFLLFVTPIGVQVLMTENQPLDSVYTWVPIWSLGVLKSSKLFLDLVLRRSIGVLQQLQLIFLGSSLSYMNFKCLSQPFQPCIVIT